MQNVLLITILMQLLVLPLKLAVRMMLVLECTTEGEILFTFAKQEQRKAMV